MADPFLYHPNGSLRAVQPLQLTSGRTKGLVQARNLRRVTNGLDFLLKREDDPRGYDRASKILSEAFQKQIMIAANGMEVCVEQLVGYNPAKGEPELQVRLTEI